MTNQIAKSIKTKFLALAIAVLSIFGLNSIIISSFGTNAYAEDICTVLDAGSEAYKANGCGGSGTDNLRATIIGIVNGVVGILSLVAVIFVVIGGINYMTSAGDPSKVKKAKDTILYAVIGLVVAVLSFAIVNFVIAKVLGQ